MTDEIGLPDITPIEVNKMELLLRIKHEGEENVFRIKPVTFWALWMHFKISFGKVQWKRYVAQKRSVRSSTGERKQYFEKEQCPYPFSDYSIEFGWWLNRRKQWKGSFEFIRIYYKDELAHEITF